MRLTPTVRESFRVGKFEEFLDRGEDHLRARFHEHLPRTRDVSSSQWRNLVRDSYGMARELGRPSEVLTIMIAKARVAFGWGVFKDIRFHPLAKAVTELAGAGELDKDPVEEMLAETDAFWTEDRLSERRGAFAALYADFEQSGSWDKLFWFLTAKEQTQGVYSDHAVRTHLEASREAALAFGLEAQGDFFRFAVLFDCHGAAFHEDPFHPEFLGCMANARTIQHALDQVARRASAPATGAVR